MEIPRYRPNDIQYLPTLPGIYIFYNHKEEPLYVGKAKNIKKRVSSYFSSSRGDNIKTCRMVAHIASIAYTVVNSAYDALLLENNLIKALHPRYNILLKDDKTYPYLCITSDRFPKLIVTRKTLPSLGKYYGPFTSSQSIRQTVAIIRQLFTFRSCNYNLSKIAIAQKKFKVCLEYHLGLCKGPCQAFQDEASYQQEIAQIEALLKNNFVSVKQSFKQQMLEAAALLDYKKAQYFKEKLNILEQYQAKSLVVNTLVGDIDVVAIVEDQDHLFMGYLCLKQGAIAFTQQRVFAKKLEENTLDLVALIVLTLRSCSNSQATEVLVNLPLDLAIGSFSIKMPKMGDKRKLVELALKNALLCKKAFLHKAISCQDNFEAMLLTLQHDLNLKEIPYCIECFDNSNIQGYHPVSAMVCFKNGQPSPKDYRHYNLNTVTTPNDCASMYEAIERRYSRLVQSGKPLPNLIVVDGGKGQLNAAIDALQKVGIHESVAIVSLAKRLEQIYLPHTTLPVCLSKQSSALKLLQRLRDEAHRFALAFHRTKRSKMLVHSVWEEIPGIGSKTLTKLWQKFATPNAIRTTSLAQLSETIGPAKAKALYDYLHKQAPNASEVVVRDREK